jgi:hypothetical protein
MLGVAIACGPFLAVFSYCPFTVHFVLINWLDSIERIEAGKTVGSKSRQ